MPTLTLEAAQDLKALFAQMSHEQFKDTIERMMADNGFDTMSVTKEGEEGSEKFTVAFVTKPTGETE